MINYSILILTPILIFFLIFICKKYSILNNFSGDLHQRFAEKNNIPLIGGIFILIGFIFIFYNLYFNLSIFCILIFFLGISSDTKILKSPELRFFLQILLVYSFIYLNNISINDTRILFLNHILQNEYINYLFVLFCLMILINGSNFIDGLNTLLIGYYIIVSFFLLELELIESIGIRKEIFYSWFYILAFIFFFNFFKKIFMGDSGAYLIGFIYGFFVIEIHQNNPMLSPFFIVLLVWYPCFEILFSILRKFKYKRSPVQPDTKHFHQLLYFYNSKKFKINKKYLNTFTASLINVFNFLIIFLGSLDIYNTQLQIILIIISTSSYCYFYLRLFLYRYKR